MSFHAPESEESHDLGGGFFEDAPAVGGGGCVVGEERERGDEAEAEPSSGWLAASEHEVVSEMEANMMVYPFKIHYSRK